MALFTFWHGDDYPAPKRKNHISVKRELDVLTLARLMNLTEQDILKRFREGNEAWVLRLKGMPVSFGWLGRQKARIGELSKEIDIPKGNAYLWNFRTLEPYRGRGYYVQLLGTILQAEEKVSERIWIISAPENQSSFNGIVKAGFRPVGDIMFNYKNDVVLLASSANERTVAAAETLQLPITTDITRPCWRCASNTMKKQASCDCYENSQPCQCRNQNTVTATKLSTV
ncbi:MAG: hypothetical protein RIB71_14500 [Imperialibacter sp.]|uniref:hypothetical protein n=1 Tax=Imperialibacter sp. TaxID=2038411 RepID=UPI0032EB8200